MDPRIAPFRCQTGTKPEKGKVIAAEISRYGTAMSGGGELCSVRMIRRFRLSQSSFVMASQPVSRAGSS
jgi:hypothetical protein